jgi:hypothetical protein
LTSCIGTPEISPQSGRWRDNLLSCL